MRDALAVQMMSAENGPDENAKIAYNQNLITDDELESISLEEMEEKTKNLKKAFQIQRGLNLKEKFSSHHENREDNQPQKDNYIENRPQKK